MLGETNPTRDAVDHFGADVPLLPPVAHTRDGQEVIPNDDIWTFRKRRDGG